MKETWHLSLELPIKMRDWQVTGEVTGISRGQVAHRGKSNVGLRGSRYYAAHQAGINPGNLAPITPTKASAEAPGGREGGRQSNMAGPGTTSSGPAWGAGAQEEPRPRMLTGSGARAPSAQFDGCFVGEGSPAGG